MKQNMLKNESFTLGEEFKRLLAFAMFLRK